MSASSVMVGIESKSTSLNVSVLLYVGYHYTETTAGELPEH